MLLVGLAAVGQIGDRVAGQGLELHITGAAAEAGAVGPAIGAGLLQGMEVGGNVGVEGKAVLLQFRDVPIGLVHHIDNGRLLLRLVGGRRGSVGVRVEGRRGVFLCRSGVIEDLVNGFFRVAFGLADFQIGEVGQEAGDDAVIAVIAVLHPCVGHDTDGLGHGRLQKDAEDQRTGRRRTGCKAEDAELPARLLSATV